MEKSIIKFLEFNGKAILFLSIDGEYWVALKPICDALNIEWTRQFKNLKEHNILGDALANQPMRDTKNRVQMMSALPEKYIYGWLFSINSDNDALQEYQKKCYDILYGYFHGSIAARHLQLTIKAETQNEILNIEERLKNNDDYLKLMELKAKEMRIGKTYK